MAKGQGEGCDVWRLPSHHGEHKGRDSTREVHHSVIPYGPKAGKSQSALLDKGNMVYILTCCMCSFPPLIKSKSLV